MLFCTQAEMSGEEALLEEEVGGRSGNMRIVLSPTIPLCDDCWSYVRKNHL